MKIKLIEIVYFQKIGHLMGMVANPGSVISSGEMGFYFLCPRLRLTVNLVSRVRFGRHVPSRPASVWLFSSSRMTSDAYT